MYLKAALEGSFFRQYTVGVYYRDGIGVEVNNEKAFYWFNIAANNGFRDAMYELGQCYVNGIGTNVDHAMAVYWYLKAARERHSDAKFIINNLSPADIISFLDKVCNSRNEKLSSDAKRLKGYIQYDLYKDDADNGDLGAMKNLGICYEKGIGTDEDLSQALYWYKKAADEGDADCLYFLGMFYKEGTGVEKDEYQTYRYFKAASEKGHLDATYELSHCYEYAYGVDEDIEEAFYLYDHLCRKGYRKAQIAMVLLVMFDSNNFTPEQIDKALYYLEQAGEAGYEDSRGMLFTYYSIGVRPIKKDESKALYWAEKLAEEGEIKYQREAYERYNEGIGTAVNKQKAMYYLEKAAESGDIDSQVEVCNIYIDQDDQKKAFYWLKKLAEGDLEEAYYLLGIRYVGGIGTERNYSKAFYWIKKAAEAGNVDGMEKLYKMYHDGVGTEKNMREYRYWKRKWDQNK
ncbi:MAG: sel1 repeat family protein [Clostridiales bacterium]|nr:sel1 repeat family protein [Clostridiales bacterium]